MPETVLFPHTQLETGLIEKLSEAFGSLILCQPWYTEPTAFSSPASERCCKVCFPPETLKPKEDFKHLLSEYQGWMMENRGKSHPAPFFSNETGDETWSIRNAIRNIGKSADDPALRNTLKWHLVLHLARDLEEERDTAEQLLKKATATKSPLADAVDNGEKIPDMFGDLPPIATDPYVTDRHLDLILEAWFGLFGFVIPADSELLTLDQHVMRYTMDLFDGCDVQPLEDLQTLRAEETNGARFRIHRQVLPHVLNPITATNSVLQSLSGKTLKMLQ